ncbi:MAG: zinc-ribbon domain-containing protein [Ruminococcaceae bacterium]|nr:zinc-ribbon domain-containing protein [Oscillospiraceae bacterium]
MFCQKCGKEINDDATVCIHCGCSTGNSEASSTSVASFCSHCGKEVNPNAVVCVHCGCSIKKQRKSANTDPEKNHKLLATLSFLIPILGIILYFIKSDNPERADYLKNAIGGIVVIGVLYGILLFSSW